MHGNRFSAISFRAIFLTFLTLLWMILIFYMSSAIEDESRVKDVADAMGDSGRILVRESGTDPKIRVMVEAESVEVCEKFVDSMIEVIKAKGHVAEKKISLWSLKYGSGEYIRVQVSVSAQLWEC